MMDPASPGLSDVAIPSTTEVAKRKVDANAGSGTRPKRNRYISLAWYTTERTSLSYLLTLSVTNASVAKLNAMARLRANGVATWA